MSGKLSFFHHQAGQDIDLDNMGRFQEFLVDIIAKHGVLTTLLASSS